MMAKIIPHPIRGMSFDKRQLEGDFDMFHLDMCIVSRGAKPKIRWSAMCQDINFVLYFGSFIPMVSLLKP